MGAILLLAFAAALQAEPPRAVLGETGRVRLRISAPDAPADARIELWSSTGSVVEVKRESAGLFSAAYVPPAQAFPQVALLLATVRAGGGSELAWLALPLVAKATLPVQTKPRSRVEVAIGGAVFGPVLTNAAGKARIAVRIPPGARKATVRVRDPFGNVNETSSDLQPPPFQRLRLIALRDQASWADPEPLPIEIFAVAPDGTPAAAADLVVTADRGELSALQQRGPGLFRATFRAPSAAGGTATVRAMPVGELRGESAVISVLSGPLARIRLTATPAALTGAGEVRIAAELLDGRDNPVPEELVLFTSDGGELRQDGMLAVLRVSDGLLGRKEIRVGARSLGVEGSLQITLLPDPATVAIEVLQPPAGEERTDGVAVGVLLGGQSNLAHANAATLQAEVAAHPGVRAVEILARAALLQFAGAREMAGDVSQRGDLRGFSLAAGVRGVLPLPRRFSAHAAVLVGALRSFGTLAIDGGTFAGMSQPTAQWGPLLTAIAGASLRLGNGRAVAELQLSHAPGRGDVVGNLGGIGLSFGYLLALR
ncbi:MAG TPA: hypothetical protein VFE90_23730 [Myxococcales bacterium]|nr:hypothetical protein [Myxococcales bacterium]